MIDFFISYGWIFWLALVLLFLTIEMFTLDFTFLMIAIGSIGGLVSSLFEVPWFIQVLIAAAVSALLVFLLRPPLLRRLRGNSDPVESNIAAVIGLRGVVVMTLVSDGGQVKLSNGETWTAQLSPHAVSTQLGIGERVVVEAIQGATALVVPDERTQPNAL